MNTTPKMQPQRSSITSIIKSVFSAMLGVQSRGKAGQDFQQSNMRNFIIVGIAMVIIFIMSLVWVVNLVLTKS